MAKYEVLFACGHTATIQLFGKHTDRESYIAWCRGNRVCPACYERAKLEEKKKKLAEYKVEAEKAKDEADVMGLPLLEGSEKQVSWAMNIRKKLLPVADTDGGYLNEKGELCDSFDEAFFTLEMEEAVRMMNLGAHLIEAHIPFNIRVLYTVEAYQTRDISKRGVQRLSKMKPFEFVGDICVDDEVAIRCIEYEFKDISGSLLVTWKWKNPTKGTRLFLGFDFVNKDHYIHDERLLVVGSSEQTAYHSLLLNQEQRYLGYANENINETVKDILLRDSWKWVNSEEIVEYFERNADEMIGDDLSNRFY